ncbi:hypothetical protein BTO32_15515 [Marinobacter lutaoensis]|uniref:Uncharacterized protein n=1 Tax=Marinobacter lutaoensis TaxID=135739 RepID=A0A1V2DPQ7_9GAMM|nr:hypothetical protein [Marinobacter lutaoensis]ONF42612.1 hypothetical protein BTO32_15515 [Marinobacter lutaoensis]
MTRKGRKVAVKKRRFNGDVKDPKTPIDGTSIGVLQEFLAAQSPLSNAEARAMALTNMDVAFLLNIQAQQLPGLRNAPSSLHVTDRRINRKVPAEKADRKQGQSLKCIRPYHAILIRLFLRHPEYASIIPPRPADQEIYELIQPFMRMPEHPLNPPEKDTARWFALYFGRSVATSYKMLRSKSMASQRENSRPVVQIQTLIALRFAKEFRELYEHYWQTHIPDSKRNRSMYRPQAWSWDVLLERDSLTSWMNQKLYIQFVTELYERWLAWWDYKFMQTLELEAISRSTTLQEVMNAGNWAAKGPASPPQSQQAVPITGAPGGLLANFRALTGLSSSEMVWVLGISPKTYFRFRKQHDTHIDPSVSILVRHFYLNPEDLELFVPSIPKGDELYQIMTEIDPTLERKHLGVFFGCGTIAGYNMSRPDAHVPNFARRAASLIVRYRKESDQIYWDIRDAVEREAKSRNIKLDQLWKNGSWNENADQDEQEMEDS